MCTFAAEGVVAKSTEQFPNPRVINATEGKEFVSLQIDASEKGKPAYITTQANGDIAKTITALQVGQRVRVTGYESSSKSKKNGKWYVNRTVETIEVVAQ